MVVCSRVSAAMAGQRSPRCPTRRAAPWRCRSASRWSRAGSTCCDESLLAVIPLTVIAFNDTPADGSLQVRFDELGGSIGRAATNQLVLPDPERMVSRVAAQVVYRNG